jgi:hypothetical protein
MHPRWRQFSLRSLLIGVLIVAAICGLITWWLRPATIHPGYFPIAVGYRWVYASRAGNAGDDVIFEVVGMEKVGDAECFVVVRTIGDHELKFYVEVTPRGVMIHQVGEERYNPPYRQFAFHSKKGDQWEWTGKIGDEPAEYTSYNNGEQAVSVPLGEWTGFLVAQEAPDSDHGDTNFWLVDGIGVVRISAKYRDIHDPPAPPRQSERFDWQLKDFTRGK